MSKQNSGAFALGLVAVALAFLSSTLALPTAAQASCTTKAFPTAVGFAECATGGRGGDVYYVTSFADDGPNTLRAAIGQTGPRTILFAFPGVIELEKDLEITHGDVTIIGLPYSPTITGAGVVVKADNVILRHLAIKVGSQSGGIGDCQPDAGCPGGDWCNKKCAKDALYLKRVKDVMLDHLSLYWATDEILSADGVERVTVSNTIIAEPLHWSLKHHENCNENRNCPFDLQQQDDEWGHGHGYCQRWGGSKKVSIVGSLFMNCYQRGLQTNSDEQFDSKFLLVNNVFYDYYQHAFRWRDNDGGDKDAKFVFRNNYFVAPHPEASNGRFPFDPPGYHDNDDFAKTFDISEPKGGSEIELWMKGNFEEGGDANCDLIKGSILNDNKVDCYEVNDMPSFVDTADPIPRLSALSSQSNLWKYLLNVGRRQGSQLDTYDTNLVNAVIQGQNQEMLNVEPTVLTGSSGGHAQGCVVNSGTLPASLDADCDGMPDAWEQAHGLNAWSAADGQADQDGDGYTNLEEWMFNNSL